MKSRTLQTSRILPLGVSAVVLASGASAFAQAEAGNTVRVERLEKENQELRKRLEALESMAKKEGWAPSPLPTNVVKALSSIQLSGFVTTSYFYDTSRPPDQISNGYLWNTTENSFSINKIKLTLASPPVERSGDKFDAGFRTSLIFGEDASIVNTGGEVQGLEALREAYVELNVPIGTGLNIKAGQLISLLNYESGDGGAANPNFSQGFQWFYTGNGPSAGLQVGYDFTDAVNIKARVQNGLYAGAIDNNTSKGFMGSIGLKPVKDLWLSLIGFYSHENATFSVGGGSVLAGYQVTAPLGLGFEFDYFNFDLDPAPSAKLWSVGGWVTYDLTPSFGIALRGEYLDDKDGFGINGVSLPGRPGSAITSPDVNGTLASITLTLNYKPFPNVKIQPEVRYDHTSYSGGFDGKENRVLVGAGISYLF
jgi:Putative beta-barrel porin-2, OmpL-like. bbp2